MNKLPQPWLRFSVALGLALLLLGGIVGAAAAFDFRSGDTITIQSNETVDDDLFISAQKIVVDGTVNGDLFVVGETVEVNGAVNGSVFAAGQTLTVNGAIAGSVYGAGMSLTYGPQAVISRNAAFGGFSLKTEPGSVITRDLIASGYQTVLGGEIGRDLTFDGGALELNGNIGGDVTADVGSPDSNFQQAPSFWPGMPDMIPPGLRVEKEASIGGKLTYTSPVEQAAAIQITPEGGVTYQAPPPDEETQPQGGLFFSVVDWVIARLRDFITLMLLGLLAVWQAPALLNSVTEQARTKPLPAAVWGLVVVIVGYIGLVVIAILVLCVWIILGVITLGGLADTIFGVGFSTLSLVFTVFNLLVSYGSKIVIAYLGGQWITRRLLPKYAENKWLPLVIGVVIYIVVRSIPILGWLIGVGVTLMGLGAMWLLWRKYRQPPTLAPVATAPTTP